MFNYLTLLLCGEQLSSDTVFKSTDGNYDKTMNSQKNQIRNSQKFVTAHMDALLKLWKVRNGDVIGLRKFYDDVKSYVRRLTTLGININGYSNLILTLIFQKLPNNIGLIVNWNIKVTWDLNKTLNLVNQELNYLFDLRCCST